MGGDPSIDVLDLTDEYIRTHECLIALLRQAYFASAQASYATGYRKAPVVVEAQTSVRFKLETKGDNRGARFQRLRICHEDGRQRGQQEEDTGQGNREPEEMGSTEAMNSLRKPEDTQDIQATPALDSLPANAFSNLISELAEKYCCSEELKAGSLVNDSLDLQNDKKQFLPLHWQTVRTRFRDLLGVMIKAADARIALEAQLAQLALH